MAINHTVQRRVLIGRAYVAIILAVSFLLICSVSGRATGGNPSLQYLQKYAGHEPANFWRDRNVHMLMVRTFGEERSRLIESKWTEGGYVQEESNLLTAFVCMPHDCGANSVTIFLNPNDGVIQACLEGESLSDGTTQDYWLMTGRVPRLVFSSKVYVDNGGCHYAGGSETDLLTRYGSPWP
jgi:hypothetical protein